MSLDNDQLVRGITYQGSIYPIPIDGDDYVNIIREEHLRIHRGQAFVCSDSRSFSAASSMGFLIYNGANNPMHLRHWEITADNSPMTFVLYEVSSSNTITTTGTPLACNNANRLSSNVTSAAFYIDSAVSSTGLQLEHSRTTGTKQAGGSKGALTTEWDLKPDHWYYFHINNNSGSATSADYYYFWYEPRDD